MSLRTIGGGEAWDNFVGVGASAGNETVGQVLASRAPGKNAVAGQDYQIMDESVVFEVKYYTAQIFYGDPYLKKITPKPHFGVTMQKIISKPHFGITMCISISFIIYRRARQ